MNHISRSSIDGDMLKLLVVKQISNEITWTPVVEAKTEQYGAGCHSRETTAGDTAGQ
jgi:hypothetical protein